MSFIDVSELFVSKGSSFSTGVEVQDKRKRVMTISTGSKSVDVILGGTWLSGLLDGISTSNTLS